MSDRLSPTTESRHGFANTIIRMKWLIPLCALVLVIGLGYGLKNLYFSTDYRAFFGPDNPQLTAFERLQNVYAKDDNVLIMIEPIAGTGTIWDASTLQAVQELTTRSWQVPHSTRVDSLTNFQHSIGTDDELIVDDLVPSDSPLDSADLTRISFTALHEPLLVHRLLSPNADATAINITVELPGKSPGEVPEIVKFVRDMSATFTAEHPQLKVYLSGMVMMNNAFPEASKGDMSTLTMSMYALIIVLTFFFTRSVAGTLGTIAVIFLSTLGALGVGGYLHIGLTPISVMAPTVIMTLAVADCIHIIVSFRLAMRNGMSKEDAIRESLRVNLGPVFITSVTTAIGFMSLVFSDAPPFQHYGIMTSVGVMLAFLFSSTVLPALLAILPSRVALKPETAQSHTTRLARCTQWLIVHRRKNFFAMTVITVLLAICIPSIELDDRFVQYFDKSIAFRTDTDHINEKLTGVYTVAYDLDSGTAQGISDPAYLAMLEQFSLWLRAQEEVMHVNTVSDIFKRINRNMHNDDDAFYVIPQEKNLAAQYLLLFEMSLPFGLDLTSLINVDKSASKVTATLQNLSTTDIRAFEKRSNEWIAEHAAGVFTGLGSSPSVMFSHISQRNIDAMIFGTMFSLVLITIVLTISMRSFSFGLLSLIPNLVPIVMGFGIWALLVGTIGMAVATVAALTLGIVVDDTVHILSKYLRARREGRSPEDSVTYAYTAVGRALIITSVILICGFLIMSQSHFHMNWSLGVLSSITIVCALVADIIMLPGLLIGGERLLAKCRSSQTHASEE